MSLSADTACSVFKAHPESVTKLISQSVGSSGKLPIDSLCSQWVNHLADASCIWMTQSLLSLLLYFIASTFKIHFKWVCILTENPFMTRTNPTRPDVSRCFFTRCSMFSIENDACFYAPLLVATWYLVVLQGSQRKITSSVVHSMQKYLKCFKTIVDLQCQTVFQGSEKTVATVSSNQCGRVFAKLTLFVYKQPDIHLNFVLSNFLIY